MSTNTRLSALESDVAEIKGSLRLLLARLDADEPAKTVRKAPAKKATPKARPAKATGKPVTLTRKTRLAFVKAAPWAKGLSTQVIAAMCVEDPSLVPAGFAVGEGYKAMFSDLA